jgi:hypothetical protein
MLQHPVTQALLSGLQEGLSQLGQPDPYAIPKVSTPGLSAENVARVDQQFLEGRHYAAEDARAKASLAMEKSRMGLDQQRLGLDKQRAASEDARAAQQFQLQKEDLASKAADRRQDNIRNIVQTQLQSAQLAESTRANRANEANQRTAQEETASFHRGELANQKQEIANTATRLANEAASQAALHQMEEERLRQSGITANTMRGKALIESRIATDKSVQEVIKTRNEEAQKAVLSGDPEQIKLHPPVTEQQAAQYLINARADLNGQHLLMGWIGAKDLGPGEPVHLPGQAEGDGSAGIMTAVPGVAITSSAAYKLQDKGISPAKINAKVLATVPPADQIHLGDYVRDTTSYPGADDPITEDAGASTAGNEPSTSTSEPTPVYDALRDWARQVGERANAPAEAAAGIAESLAQRGKRSPGAYAVRTPDAAATSPFAGTRQSDAMGTGYATKGIGATEKAQLTAQLSKVGIAKFQQIHPELSPAQIAELLGVKDLSSFRTSAPVGVSLKGMQFTP